MVARQVRRAYARSTKRPSSYAKPIWDPKIVDPMNPPVGVQPPLIARWLAEPVVDNPVRVSKLTIELWDEESGELAEYTIPVPADFYSDGIVLHELVLDLMAQLPEDKPEWPQEGS